MTADTTAVLRAELTRRLASYLPPAAIAPVANAAVDAASKFGGNPATLRKTIGAIALAACPPQYRALAEVGMAIAQGVSAWLDSRVVEVQAGSVAVRDRRR